ncbi:Tyrosinase ustQ [Lachnellula suecica]|uniref:Tyrosinase ustQ n=1 Tax=Lachnellula suecica TaxID=602035 RepID=A0A8T9CC36_9HELO|nr:Tyrosinase ustQ [Lachnellula suecica]
MYSSPGDPLFYFIHAALDRIWDQWQRADWDTRKSEISGPDTMFAYPFNFFGDIPYTNITLDYPLHYDNFGDDVKISDIMDTAADNLCYQYV